MVALKALEQSRIKDHFLTFLYTGFKVAPIFWIGGEGVGMGKSNRKCEGQAISLETSGLAPGPVLVSLMGSAERSARKLRGFKISG